MNQTSAPSPGRGPSKHVSHAEGNSHAKSAWRGVLALRHHRHTRDCRTPSVIRLGNPPPRVASLRVPLEGSVMTDIQLHFTRAEYDRRVAKTRSAMAKAGVEAILVSDPSNMAWLTGYDGWSF